MSKIIELSRKQVDAMLSDMLKSNNNIDAEEPSPSLEFVFDDENLYKPMTVRSENGEFDTDDFDFDINK